MKVQITSDGMYGAVYIDGQHISGISKVEYVHKACNIPELKLTILADELTIEGADVVPDLPDIYKPFYVPRAHEDPEPV